QRIAEKLGGGAEVEEIIEQMGAPEAHLAEASALPSVPTGRKPPVPVAPAITTAEAAPPATPQYAGAQRLSLTALIGGAWSLLFLIMVAATAIRQGAQHTPK